MSSSYVVYYFTTVLHTQHSIHDQHYWHVTCPIQIELTIKSKRTIHIESNLKTLEVVAW
jgi:hypothetical protein